MKRLAIILAAALAAFSCNININLIGTPVTGNGTAGEKNFEFETFDAIRVAGAMDVTYIQRDGKSGAVLRTDENLLEEYTLEVEDGTLVICPRKGINPIPSKGTEVTVCAPCIDAIKFAGSGDCNIPDGFASSGDFSFTLAGSGDFYAYSIKCKEFSAKVGGSGDIKAGSIEAESASFSVAGSGDIEVDALTSEKVTIGITGSGSAEVGCRGAGDIDINITGSGRVDLKGSARSLSQRISGSGSVNARGLTLSGE